MSRSVPEGDDLVAEQIRYYDARADEYEAMMARERRYDPDGFDNPEPSDRDTIEIGRVVVALEGLDIGGDVLEIACGTGLWTTRLAPRADRMTVIDSSPNMLAKCKQRVSSEAVEFVQASIFDWTSDRRHDVIFFGFWLSHVPLDLFEGFWAKLATALKPDGYVVFVDERDWDANDGEEIRLDDGRGGARRTLQDGHQYRMVKVYWEPEALATRLAELGWDTETTRVGDRIFWGTARPHS